MDGLWAFAGLALVLSLTPGPDDFLVLGCTLRGGPRAGVAATLGVAAGSSVWGVAAATGLASLVAHSPAVYEGLRWTGAGFLIALGAVPMLRRQERRAGASGRHAAPVRLRGGPAGSFAAGLASDLLNPKIGIFYLVVVPQFVPPGEGVLDYSILLCAIDVGLATLWLLVLVAASHVLARRLASPPVLTWTRRASGAALVGMGAAAAAGL